MMPRIHSSWRKLVGLFALGLLLMVAKPAQAKDGNEMVRDAHDQLQQAGEAAGSERIDHLIAAREILDHLPPGSNGRHCRRAKGYIKSALFEDKRGNPEGRELLFIQDADSEVRSLVY